MCLQRPPGARCELRSSDLEGGERQPAHTFCDFVAIAEERPLRTYVAIFGPEERLTSYRADLRDARVQALIKKHPPTF